MHSHDTPENTMLACYYSKRGDHASADIVGRIPVPNLALARKQLATYPERLFLLKVHFASINPVDYKQRSGDITHFLLPKPFPIVHGFDFLGTILEISSGIIPDVNDPENEDLKVGDSVFGMVKALDKGSLAEYMIVSESICVKAPEESVVPHYKAATVPLVGITSILAFRHCGLDDEIPEKNAQKRVLILGGAGGVGSTAIQLAKRLYKVEFVATTASPGWKTDLCKDLGADLVVDYRSHAELSKLEKFDVVYDTVGTPKVGFPYLKPRGKICSIAGSATCESLREWVSDSKVVGLPFGVRSLFFSSVGGTIVNMVTGALFTKLALRNSVGSHATYGYVTGRGNKQIMLLLRKELENGNFKPVVMDDNVFELSDALLALEALEKGRVAGKISIKI